MLSGRSYSKPLPLVPPLVDRRPEKRKEGENRDRDNCTPGLRHEEDVARSLVLYKPPSAPLPHVGIQLQLQFQCMRTPRGRPR